MVDWEARDVAMFLLEMTHDLGIKYENADLSQLSNVDGRKLLTMEPKHFDKVIPKEGQRVYDYIRHYINHEMLAGTYELNNLIIFSAIIKIPKLYL